MPPNMACGAESLYQLSGKVTPAGEASITVFGATTPFNQSTLCDAGGKFTFRKLQPGTYTISVFNPEYGEARRTVEVGPGTAQKDHRVFVSLTFEQSDFTRAPIEKSLSVSTRQLAIPDKARHQYEESVKELQRHEVEAAVKNLEQAVEEAPQFSTAWNQLGTICYQTRKFDRAEECFRKALDADPKAFEPLVNLGGVLVTLGRTNESLNYNRYAVLARPNDALANAQLGQSYFQAGNYDMALKYLEIARHLDPAHFSHPQLVMAEIHLRRGERASAAADLEDFLAHHPDWPTAAQMREMISKLKK